MESYFEVLTAAVNDIAEHGYDSQERIEYWSQRIREAAERSLDSVADMERRLREAMASLYSRLVDRGGALQFHPGVAAFTLERIRPHLRAALDRRIQAAAELIKLNREAAIQTTLKRFNGWATSIPREGSDQVGKVETKTEIRKSMARLPFEERRVIIDQNSKLRSSIDSIIATDGGAIAGVWHSHWRDASYNYRPDHKERDGKIYLIRGCWAQDQGLVKVGEAGYTDEITQPAEEIYCRCWYAYIYNLGKLPSDMMTVRGKQKLQEVREAMNA